MAKYIDKSAVVAEIDAKRDKIKKRIFSIPLTGQERAVDTLIYDILGRIKDFIDSLEVKEVELEKLINDYMFPITAQDVKEEPFTQLEKCAKHFFELGLKAKATIETIE